MNKKTYHSIVIGFILNGILITFPIILGDWWGLANVIALSTGAMLRVTVIRVLRDAVNFSASKAAFQSQELVKTLWSLPDGTMVTMYTCRGLVTECLLCDAKPRNHNSYRAFQVALWVVFGIHIMSIGMASLPTQILTVIILASSTICVILGFGNDSQAIGSYIQVRRFDQSSSSQSMASMFARLHLTEAEETCMVSWRLMPSTTNQTWWIKYRNNLMKGTEDAFGNWKAKTSWQESDTLLLGMDNQLSTENLNIVTGI